jgi:hypothetical protein
MAFGARPGRRLRTGRLAGQARKDLDNISNNVGRRNVAYPEGKKRVRLHIVLARMLRMYIVQQCLAFRMKAWMVKSRQPRNSAFH